MSAYRCRLGAPTDIDPALAALTPLACDCELSCETHEHSSSERTDEDWTICFHDGVNDHGHCPNAALDSLTDADA